MDADKKAALAGENFRSGYNCAQSVLLAFCEETGLKKEAAARFASSFGGGMGRMREVCGAVSGMFMVAGLLTGYDDPKDRAAKAALYERVRNLAGQFTEKNGSIICRKLLEGVPATGGGAPGERTETYYRKRPCTCYVEDAARLVAEALGAQSGNGGQNDA